MLGSIRLPVDDRHPQEQGLKQPFAGGLSVLLNKVDDRHPQEQGLKHWTGRQCARDARVDDRHPQEQGLKP